MGRRKSKGCGTARSGGDDSDDITGVSGHMLKNMGYMPVGKHSAVKPCMWLNRAMHGGDACYKGWFYGVESHRCLQMTPWLECNQRCRFCWRPHDLSNISAGIDSPEELAEGCLAAHYRFTCGYGGDPAVDDIRFKESEKPRHAAVSLAGEPTLYPSLSDLLDCFHDRGMTTFLVTNGTKPEVLAEVEPTQMYISLDAWDEKSYREVCNPVGPRFDDVKASLQVMADRDCRTAIRTTLVNGLNMKKPKRFAELAEAAQPDFVEVKGYVHVGYSRNRLKRDAMPSHDDVVEFAREYGTSMGYELCDDVEISRVALLTPNGSNPHPLA